MPDEKKEIIKKATPVETGLNVAASVTSLVPWIGGPVSSVLSGISLDRRFDRVREVLEGLAESLKDFKSEASEAYVKKEEFHELLEKTLKLAAEERNEQKRNMFREFLVQAVTTPGEPYDEQIRHLRTLEALQADHIRILQALLQVPEPNLGIMGSPMQTLQKRLPDMSSVRINDLVEQLNDLGLTRMSGLQTMMTAHGAANLRHSITSYGDRFLWYVKG